MKELEKAAIMQWLAIDLAKCAEIFNDDGAIAEVAVMASKILERMREKDAD